MFDIMTMKESVKALRDTQNQIISNGGSVSRSSIIAREKCLSNIYDSLSKLFPTTDLTQLRECLDDISRYLSQNKNTNLPAVSLEYITKTTEVVVKLVEKHYNIIEDNNPINIHSALYKET